ncbi:hypothetical protein V6Z12_D02G028600 [Gossypium hirsutum]
MKATFNRVILQRDTTARCASLKQDKLKQRSLTLSLKTMANGLRQ